MQRWGWVQGTAQVESVTDGKLRVRFRVAELEVKKCIGQADRLDFTL